MVTAAMKLKDAPWKKSCDKPRQCIKKQRHHFVNKGLYIQSYGFSISHVLTENWIIKKTEPWRIVAFELWCWRRLPRVPWTTRKSSPSILKEINPEYSLEGLMLKLKLQYFGHLMWRADSLGKSPTLGRVEGKRRRRQLRMRWLNNITNSMEMNFHNLRDIVEDRGSRCVTGHGVAKSWTWLRDWTCCCC